MTKFPSALDTDLELPPVWDNIVEIGEEAINAVRSAMFAVEETLGINPQGSLSSVADRLNVSLNADGTVKPSAIAGLGLVVLPITNDQVSPTAAIDESKLNLIYSTSFLYTLFANLDAAVDVLEGFVSTTGIKVEPHISGAAFRHKLSHIDMNSGTLNKVNISTGTVISRDLTNAYTFASELSNDLLSHTRADNSGNTTTPPANQAHNASGIYINSSNFVSVPQTADDLQSFAEFVDNSSLVLLGSRTQNLFGNGIPRATRNTSLINDTAAEAIVDPTPATTYLLFSAATAPVDDIEHGDNVILLNPGSEVLANNTFDAQFSQVKPGDYITINYGNGTVPVQFTIDSTKKFLNGSTRVYSVRINGKNLYASSDAIIRIDRPFFHNSKYNSLALAAANNSFSELPSLIISNPGGATALGIGFDPDKLDQGHYNLYLALYPTGNPVEKTLVLPAIDVTGDTGNNVGSYSLDGVVETINNKFRQPGFNFRFIAFAYQGQIGITLADRYNDASFSIISGNPDGYGDYTASSNASFPNNIVDNYNGIDPFGFGLSGANVASPPFAISYSTPATALAAPTVIFSPLRKNFFYVDGVERDDFALEVNTIKDGYGDGYWAATLITKQILANRVEVAYEIPLDLCTSGLKVGKTLVVQPAVDIDSSSYNAVDYGRFIISNIAFNNCPGPTSTTTITVYDAIHGTGVSPYLSSINLPVFIYFSDDSVSFNKEHVSDPITNVSFKRFFEVFIDANGKSFTHERARFNTSGSNLTVDSINSFTLYSSAEMAAINLVDISPKLRGYAFGQYRKISLIFNNYNEVNGTFDGYMCKFESPSTYTHIGPTSSGKKGEVVRFYDDTHVDYIDVSISRSSAVSTFANKQIDIQLFPSLQDNREKIIIGTCQLQDTNKQITYLKDKRQFGNITERQFSTSAINYINAPQRLLNENGIVRGFDLVSSTTLTNDNEISVRGGAALIDGKLLDFNDAILSIPIVRESLSPGFTTNVDTIRWYLCINSSGEFEFIASTDYDTSLTGTYGSLTHERLFYVKNPTLGSGSAYPIRATYFNKLLSDFKDLLPLYVVTATVGLSTTWKVTSATISDTRRFIEKGYNGLSQPFTLGRLASFRTLESFQTYINELTSYISFVNDGRSIFGQSVYVRDTMDISGATFNHAVKIKYIGDGGKFTFSSPVTVNQNTEFNNLNMTISDGYGIKITGNDVTIDSCNITYSYDATSDSDFSSSQLSNLGKACIYGISSDFTNSRGKNISIKNCKFTTSVSNHFPFIALLLNGQTHYYENIIIENNQIENSISSDDKLVAIALSSMYISTPSTQTGARLVNCRISKNVCNKNQLIIMSGSANGSSKIANMPVPVNVSIDKNICGAICYLTRQDRALNIANTTTILDKDNMLLISQNMCRYIYCGTNKGFINVVGSSNRVYEGDDSTCGILSGSDIYSSSVIIDKNTCSWIQVGVKNPTSYSFETPILEISNNKINAYNATFLDDYHSVISANNIGLIADSIVGT